MTLWKRCGAGAALVLVTWSTGCGDDATGPAGFAARMYIADVDAFSAFVYRAPYAPADGPSDSLKRGTRRFAGVAVDASGNLAAAVQATPSWVFFYDAPVRNGDAPRDSVRVNDFPSLATLGPGGRLFVATQASGVFAYSPPFSGTSVPDTLAKGTTNQFAVAFDANDRMYVTDQSNGVVDVYDSPYTGAKAFSITGFTGGYTTGVVVDKDGRLFVADAFTNEIVAFQPPLSGSSTPAFAIGVGVETPTGMAIGSDGRLYVVNLGAGTPFVTIFDPPFSAVSAPTVTMSGGGSLITPYGIAVGPR